MRNYYVYMMASPSRVLYVGVTNNLERRVFQHKEKTFRGFTAKYGVAKLVYYEPWNDIRRAINREKQIKAWRRSKKTTLIEAANPGWKDLSAEWAESIMKAIPPPTEAVGVRNDRLERRVK
jgi:putative endonuclease